MSLPWHFGGGYGCSPPMHPQRGLRAKQRQHPPTLSLSLVPFPELGSLLKAFPWKAKLVARWDGGCCSPHLPQEGTLLCPATP